VLSKQEINFLTDELKASQTYKRVLKYRIREKLKQFFYSEITIDVGEGVE